MRSNKYSQPHGLLSVREDVRLGGNHDVPRVRYAQDCRPRCAIGFASVLASALVLAMVSMSATAVRAERWYVQEGLCLDLDSVSIIDGPGSTPRLVAFRMGRCGTAELIEQWSIDLEDCGDAKSGGDGIILYRLTGQGTWNLMSLYDHEDPELRQAAVACNWSAPRPVLGR